MRQKIAEIILVTVLFFPLPTLLLQTTAPGQTDTTIVVINYLFGAIPHIAVIIYLLYLQKIPLASYGIVKPKASTIGWTGAAFGLALVVMFTVTLVYSLFPDTIRDNLGGKQPFGINSALEIPLAFLLCLAVGYREEIYFRSYLTTRFTELGVKPVPAVIGVSLVFGMAHWGQGVIGVVTTFFIGVVFGLIFNAKKDLHAVALAHTFYNFAVILMAFFGAGATG